MIRNGMISEEILQESTKYTKEELLDKLSKTKNLSGREIKILLSFFARG